MLEINIKKLAIYYGYPSLINNSTSINDAIAEFNNYDLVVFGDGIEESSHPDHANGLLIINQSTANIYGYVNCNRKLSKVIADIDKWCIMGVAGIFCDQFGFGFDKITRNRQNQIINYIHSENMIVFANVYNPDDLFGTHVHIKNPNQLPTAMTSSDWYLAQSFYYSANFDIPGSDTYKYDWKQRADNINVYKSQIGFNVATNTTTTDSANINPFPQNKLNEAFFATAMCGFNAYCYGERYYSAIDSLMPYRTRPNYIGNKLRGNIVVDGDIYYRYTNIGFSIDTNNHSVDYIT